MRLTQKKIKLVFETILETNLIDTKTKITSLVPLKKKKSPLYYIFFNYVRDSLFATLFTTFLLVSVEIHVDPTKSNKTYLIYLITIEIKRIHIFISFICKIL